jgi:ectoine hydroxylase-related dioxygenase (phytanoyl-CoA dioxygenase family)
MTEINVTTEERASGTLSAAHLDEAKRAIREDGFVVLADVVDTAHLDILHERLIEDLKALQARPDAPYNWNAGNIQQDPPPFPPYLFRDVLLNNFAVAVTHAVLGPGVKSTMYSGNTALKSESRQPVHADFSHLWPEQEVAHPPVYLIVNVPTVNMSAENGSTEIWPGTHRDLSAAAGKDIKITPDVLEARRAVVPPLQPTVRRGSILIRDGRLWHAGMPNRTDNPRPMIAMMHQPGWIGSGDPLRFPKGTEAFFQHPLLHTAARFLDEPIDHISSPSGYEYVK